jgi:hypothetical protein
MIKKILATAMALSAGAVLVCGAAHAQAPRTPAPAGAEVYFVNLTDGARVPTKFRVNFGLRNMGVAPAGSERVESGHHHLIVDVPTPSLDREIPNDFNHLHFGNGQTEAEITLPPGEHTLQLLLADRNHVPHDPPIMSNVIRVVVYDAAAPAQGAQTPASTLTQPVAVTPPAATPTPAPQVEQRTERPRKEKRKREVRREPPTRAERRHEPRQAQPRQANPRNSAAENTRRNLGGCVIDLGNGRTEPCR